MSVQKLIRGAKNLYRVSQTAFPVGAATLLLGTSLLPSSARAQGPSATRTAKVAKAATPVNAPEQGGRNSSQVAVQQPDILPIFQISEPQLAAALSEIVASAGLSRTDDNDHLVDSDVDFTNYLNSPFRAKFKDGETLEEKFKRISPEFAKGILEKHGVGAFYPAFVFYSKLVAQLYQTSINNAPSGEKTSGMVFLAVDRRAEGMNNPENKWWNSEWVDGSFRTQISKLSDTLGILWADGNTRDQQCMIFAAENQANTAVFSPIIYHGITLNERSSNSMLMLGRQVSVEYIKNTGYAYDVVENPVLSTAVILSEALNLERQAPHYFLNINLLSKTASDCYKSDIFQPGQNPSSIEDWLVSNSPKRANEFNALFRPGIEKWNATHASSAINPPANTAANKVYVQTVIDTPDNKVFVQTIFDAAAADPQNAQTPWKNARLMAIVGSAKDDQRILAIGAVGSTFMGRKSLTDTVWANIVHLEKPIIDGANRQGLSQIEYIRKRLLSVKQDTAGISFVNIIGVVLPIWEKNDRMAPASASQKPGYTP